MKKHSKCQETIFGALTSSKHTLNYHWQTQGSAEKLPGYNQALPKAFHQIHQQSAQHYIPISVC